VRDAGAHTVIVGLAGGTGSGKSSIVRSLVERVGGCVIDLESYTLDRGDDEPAAIDTELLVAHLDDLRRGEAIRKPVYSAETRLRTGIQLVAPARLVLVEFNPHFCRLLRERYPTATVIQGDAYGLRHLLTTLVQKPAAAVVSGLPLFTKPLHLRLRLLYEAFALMMPGAPFIQFTYAAVSPIPKSHGSVKAQASERIWTNFPPARVWVYRKH